METSRRFRGECNGCETSVTRRRSRVFMTSRTHLITLRCRSDFGGLHIRDRNNQRHVLLQRYACKRVRLEREASGLHNS